MIPLNNIAATSIFLSSGLHSILQTIAFKHPLASKWSSFAGVHWNFKAIQGIWGKLVMGTNVDIQGKSS
jgi:hypothetical protein